MAKFSLASSKDLQLQLYHYKFKSSVESRSSTGTQVFFSCIKYSVGHVINIQYFSSVFIRRKNTRDFKKSNWFGKNNIYNEGLVCYLHRLPCYHKRHKKIKLLIRAPLSRNSHVTYRWVPCIKPMKYITIETFKFCFGVFRFFSVFFIPCHKSSNFQWTILVLLILQIRDNNTIVILFTSRHNLRLVDFFRTSYGTGRTGRGCPGAVSHWIHYFHLTTRLLICEDDFSGRSIFVTFKFQLVKIIS